MRSSGVQLTWCDLDIFPVSEGAYPLQLSHLTVKHLTAADYGFIVATQKPRPGLFCEPRRQCEREKIDDPAAFLATFDFGLCAGRRRTSQNRKSPGKLLDHQFSPSRTAGEARRKGPAGVFVWLR